MDALLQKLEAHDELFRQLGDMYSELLDRHSVLNMQFSIAIGSILAELENVTPAARVNFFARLADIEAQLGDTVLVTQALQQLRSLVSH